MGFTTTDYDTARICNSAINRSKNVIILMDSHKINKAAAISFAKADKISLLVIDDKITNEQKNELKRSGVNYIVAKND